jgi:hypothetical protein
VTFDRKIPGAHEPEQGEPAEVGGVAEIRWDASGPEGRTGNEPGRTKRGNRMEHCFACGRGLKRPYSVECADDQRPDVGPECYRKIKDAGETGYQPPQGGPRLFLIGLGYSKGKEAKR